MGPGKGGCLTIEQIGEIASGLTGDIGALETDRKAQQDALIAAIAGRAGGAIETNTPNVLTITNVTFDGNQATGTPGNGGALHNTGISDTNVTSSNAIIRALILEHY